MIAAHLRAIYGHFFAVTATDMAMQAGWKGCCRFCGIARARLACPEQVFHWVSREQSMGTQFALLVGVKLEESPW